MLTPATKAQITKRFNILIKEAGLVSFALNNDPFNGDTPYSALKTKSTSLIYFLLGETKRTQELVNEINKLKKLPYSAEIIAGILKGLKNDFEAGFLDNLYKMVEANIAGDYLTQANQLLDEGGQSTFNHVPAAVLTGAILEDSLRRLCQRQEPPVTVLKSNGEPKTTGILIDDLKAAGLYNELKAKQLRSWAAIRNAAAHGNFEEFKRDDVVQMMSGVTSFLADYL